MRRIEREIRHVMPYGARLIIRPGHYKIIFADGSKVTCACTPKCVDSAIKHLRRSIKKRLRWSYCSLNVNIVTASRCGHKMPPL
jgi:hypothetical protein